MMKKIEEHRKELIGIANFISNKGLKFKQGFFQEKQLISHINKLRPKRYLLQPPTTNTGIKKYANITQWLTRMLE